MAKIKLNLPTGVSEEKTLISCFKSNNNIYIVLDSDRVGSMGLPIILISKMFNNRVTKIVDPEEWNAVKKDLKEIISGEPKDYIVIDSYLEADENFYTQLTLPLSSFDVLKKSYNVKENIMNESETINGVNNNNNVNIDVPINGVNTHLAEDKSIDIVNNNIEPEENVNAISSEGAVANPLLGDNVMPSLDMVLQNNNDVPIENETKNEDVINNFVTSENIIEEPKSINNYDYSVDKEAFLKACGNMFDALVANLTNKKNDN